MTTTLGGQDYAAYSVPWRPNDAAGVPCTLWLPPKSKLGASTPAVYVSHPYGQTDQIAPGNSLYTLVHALVQEGWLVAASSHSHGGNTNPWGNAAAMTDLANLDTLVNSYATISKRIVLGASMGGATAANSVSHAAVPNLVGAIAVDGVLDLSTLYSSGTYTASMDTAYGITRGTLSGATAAGATSLPTTSSFPTPGTQLMVGNGTANVETVTTAAASTGTSVAVTATTKTHASADQVSDFPSKTAGWNPIGETTSLFTSTRFRIYTGDGDTTVPRATNGDAFGAKIAAAPEAAVLSHLGSHLDFRAMWPADVVAFIKRCLAA